MLIIITALLLLLPSPVPARPDVGDLLGNLKRIKQSVSGSVYVNDDKSIITVDNFHYKGDAPDAFFLLGTRGTPSDVKNMNEEERDEYLALLSPDGGVFKYDDTAAGGVQPLARYTGEKVTLDLPKDVKKDDVAFLSVYCRQYDVIFGYLQIEDSEDIEDEDEDIEDEDEDIEDEDEDIEDEDIEDEDEDIEDEDEDIEDEYEDIEDSEDEDEDDDINEDERR